MSLFVKNGIDLRLRNGNHRAGNDESGVFPGADLLGAIRVVGETRTMRKLGLAFAAACAASLACGGARADEVVYNGGDPNQFGTFYADTGLSAAV
jgi:hypothetical protein